MVGMEVIRKYIDLLEHQLGWDIIIYDESGLLSMTELAGLTQVGKWHTNAYCLRIKSNKRLRKRCVGLKPDFVRRALEGQGVVGSTCFCGVTEYVAPIRYQGRLICMVAATGFCGDLPERILRHVGERVGLSLDQLMALRKSALDADADGGSVSAALEILASLLLQYITEETRIPALLEDADCEGNEHVFAARQYISQHFSEAIHTDSVAAHCHLSKSHLEHLFCRTIGHGIAQEIRLCRLQYARELLCTTNDSIRYISFISGFSSSDYFATAFKKHFQLSPLQYRRRKSVH